MTDDRTALPLDKRANWKWDVFAKSTPVDEAKQIFVKRFGYQPKETFIEFGVLFVGPVEDARQ